MAALLRSDAASSGYTGKPFSARSMAGARICANPSLPKRATASAQEPTTAGTQAGRYPSPGTRSMPCSRHQSTVNASGDQPMPLSSNTRFSAAE